MGREMVRGNDGEKGIGWREIKKESNGIGWRDKGRE